MKSPKAPLDLTLRGQSQGYSDFEGLYMYLIKEPS